MDKRLVAVGNLSTVQCSPATKTNGKPPVLLIHGAWHGAWCWEGNYLEYFCKEGHETWALDLRGHGKSPNSKSLRLTTIGNYVDDVASVIAAMPEPPIVIAHSMGGFICQHLMNRNVELRGIGLLASIPHYGVLGVVWDLIKTRPLKFLEANLTWALYTIVADINAAQKMFLEDDAEQATLDRLAENLGDEAYFGFLGMLALSLPRAPKRKNLPPICMVGGELDMIFPPHSQASLAARLGVAHHIVAGAPHSLMMSRNWTESAGIFSDWIAGLSEPSLSA